MIPRKQIKAASITQSNDARCFGSNSNDQKGSIHNKRAKRNSSRKARQFLAKRLKDENE